MGRIHLFEFGDQEWFPRPLRQYETDYLRHIIRAIKVHKPVIPVLASLLNSSSCRRIIDIGSGSGGGMDVLQKELEEAVGKPVDITLTDIRPRPEVIPAFADMGRGKLTYHPESVDATDLPGDLQGCITMFNSFHHFKPGEAREILRTIIKYNYSLAIVESMDDNLVQIPFQMILIPILVLIFTPFIRPFRWSRLLFTYLIPILPLVIMWDGIISVLRLYKPERMEKMGREVGPTYIWQSGKTTGSPKQLYLTGMPPKTG